MRALIAALMLIAFPAHAYQKPAGAPTLNIPEHGVTISVFAVQLVVGHAIGVFEQNGSDWTLCRDCFTNPEFPTMDPAVQAAGGGQAYVLSKIPELNAILARRYPAVMAPPSGTSGVDQTNYALATLFALKVVGGVPVIAGK